jgi:hypothetical protein
MRTATRPGRLVAPPRPESTEARPASRPAVTASVALKREVMLLNSSSHGHRRVKHLHVPSPAIEPRHVDDGRSWGRHFVVNTVYHPTSWLGDVP